MHSLRLGLFTFKNDEVLLLAGSRQALLELARSIERALTNGTTLVIHEMALVSQRHPAKLFAAKHPGAALAQNEFYWPCNLSTAERLQAVANSSSEAYFELSNPSLFLVSGGATYGTEWWQRYA